MGKEKDEALEGATDVQADGQSMGVLAEGQLEGNAYSPLGAAGVHHWQAGLISQDGLGDRNNIFFAAVEMTRMPMVVTDPRQPDNPIVFANGAFLDLTQYDQESVLGKNCRFLQGPDTSAETVAEVRTAVEEQRSIAVDILNYKRDGTPFWNALFIGPVFDKEGQLLYFFASQMDITQRRAMQQTQLQSQKLEAIGQLTAGMAHDFNNLLQVIDGNIELAKRMLDQPKQAGEALDRAHRAAEKGAKLTQQLLAFARKQRLEPKRINLNTLVVDFSDMLVRTVGDKIDLRLDLRPGLPSCTLDPTHLEMALLNVIINARDAMPEGGSIKVATALLDDRKRPGGEVLSPGSWVVVCVVDEGSGMSPDVLRRAAEPFFTTKSPGTGLGLAMVHGFVQQSHGHLEIESEAGQGTTIRMIFPVSDQLAASEPADAAKPAAASPLIMVVEDNDDVRELAERMLQGEGYRTLSAASAEQALNLLDKGNHPDALFTDVIMPGGMNGLQLAETLRRKHPQLPVLLATGYMEDLPGRSAGTQGLPVLSKPYKHQELSARIAAVLSQRPEARADR